MVRVRKISHPFTLKVVEIFPQPFFNLSSGKFDFLSPPLGRIPREKMGSSRHLKKIHQD